ncbi:MAG TPA: HNH endonuclease [Candidatus Brocadiia bacterium]|nr:HNH endonuclease [Candidatus Brocadiia bacterium]
MTTTALDASVLVLNRFYAAIHIITARKAFCLLAKSIAEVITVEDNHFATYNLESWLDVSRFKIESGMRDDEETDWVRTVSLDIEVPKVIRLITYDKLPDQTVRFNRRNIFARDENRCQYCGKKFPTQELSIDHVKPRTQGGRTIWNNIVVACTSCNKRKGGRTPDQAGMKLIKQPRAPRFSPIIRIKLTNEKYRSWKHFLNEAYWSVELKE